MIRLLSMANDHENRLAWLFTRRIAGGGSEEGWGRDRGAGWREGVLQEGEKLRLFCPIVMCIDILIKIDKVPPSRTPRTCA